MKHNFSVGNSILPTVRLISVLMFKYNSKYKIRFAVELIDNRNLLHSCGGFFFISEHLDCIYHQFRMKLKHFLLSSEQRAGKVPPLMLTRRRASLQPSPFPRTRSSLFVLLGGWLAGRCPSWRVSKMAEKTARPRTARQLPVPRAFSRSPFSLGERPSFKSKTRPPTVIIASFRVCHRLTNFSSPSMVFHLLQLKYWLRLYLFAFDHEQMTSGSLCMFRSYCDGNVRTLLQAENVLSWWFQVTVQVYRDV